MRKLALLMLTFNVVLGHGAGPFGRAHAAEPDTTETRIPRVRSNSPEVAALIGRASDASATFRRLTATIDGHRRPHLRGRRQVWTRRGGLPAVGRPGLRSLSRPPDQRSTCAGWIALSWRRSATSSSTRSKS